MAPRRPSEEELGRKWDRCLVDTTFKTVGGAVFGGVLSLLFFKRAAWPVTLGIGVGLGAGYSNCRHQLYWQGPPGPPFGGPHWGRPFWGRPGDGGERRPPFKPARADDTTPEKPVESQEIKQGEKPSES